MKLDETTPVELCPVCLFRLSLQGVGDGSQSETVEFSSGELLAEKIIGEYAHFQIETREDGSLFELGRGSMGVTYKATDKHLHRLVALKVISPQFMGDESTRRRFLREARAAASLKHANIASVFYLGSTGPEYFYAMEFF